MTAPSRLISVTALLLFFLGFYRSTTVPRQPACSDATSCNRLGTEALRRGDLSMAIHMFRLQAGYAEDEQNKRSSLVAYNNLAVAFMRKQDYFRALAWTRLALQADPGDEAARRNLSEIRRRTIGHRWPRDVGGVYVQYAGRAQWSSLCMFKTDGRDLGLRLVIYRMGAAWRQYGPAAYGDVTGTAVLVGKNEALYTGDSDFPTCRIHLRYAPSGVTLRQQGDCGFGFEVRADGYYERISAGSGDKCGKIELP